MNKIDLEHKLLKGSPINLGDIPTYRITLGQMVDFKYGYSMCYHLVNLLCLEDEYAAKFLDPKMEPLTINAVFQQLYRESYLNEKENSLYYTTLPPFLEMVFQNTVQIDPDNFTFIIGKENNISHLSKDNYDEFRDILRARFGLIDIVSEKSDNPSDDITKRFLEKQKKYKKEIERLKKENSSDLTLADLISIFSECEKIPLHMVFENYDIYQFNNQFSRLKIMEDYKINIRALLAGAKSEDVKIKHWLSKIKDEDL